MTERSIVAMRVVTTLSPKYVRKHRLQSLCQRACDICAYPVKPEGICASLVISIRPEMYLANAIIGGLEAVLFVHRTSSLKPSLSTSSIRTSW